MRNDIPPPAKSGMLFRDWLADLFRRVADVLSTIDAPRPRISAVREELARGVELALLDAEAEEERYRHTVLMLKERLTRLRDETSVRGKTP